VAPLPRTEWIKVAKQLPTKQFLNAELDVRVTLDWYFEALEKALCELFAVVGCDDEDVQVCLVGHSIGGWVARAYLGGMSGCVRVVCLYF
jgi:alpha-beta hydrolase superfamily lysophospholipase